jgi:hypothetical protein
MKLASQSLISLVLLISITNVYAINPPKTIPCTSTQSATWCNTNGTTLGLYNATSSPLKGIDYPTGTYQIEKAVTEQSTSSTSTAAEIVYYYAYLDNGTPDLSKEMLITLPATFDANQSIKPDLTDTNWKVNNATTDPTYYNCTVSASSLCPFTNTPYLYHQNTYENGISLTNNSTTPVSVYVTQNSQATSWHNTDFATARVLPNSSQQVAYVDTKASQGSDPANFTLRLHLDAQCTDSSDIITQDVLVNYQVGKWGSDNRVVSYNPKGFFCNGKSYSLDTNNCASGDPTKLCEIKISTQ